MLGRVIEEFRIGDVIGMIFLHAEKKLARESLSFLSAFLRRVV